ncbi:hypothetical protein ACFSO7_22380 [Bacillus sp. CGMCC 1.16607]|uniref:hypothetical protein n=1 Tax=Bacillus sp. CGMCC 1.16607 TaxID=3351842 RepID=UPI00363FEB2C
MIEEIDIIRFPINGKGIKKVQLFGRNTWIITNEEVTKKVEEALNRGYICYDKMNGGLGFFFHLRDTYFYYCQKYDQVANELYVYERQNRVIFCSDNMTSSRRVFSCDLNLVEREISTYAKMNWETYNKFYLPKHLQKFSDQNDLYVFDNRKVAFSFLLSDTQMFTYIKKKFIEVGNKFEKPDKFSI